MNSTAASDSTRTVPACDPAILQGTLDHTIREAYGWLVFITVICIVTCPLTTAMNALIIIAVKTKTQLKTKSNIALACLSTTDLAMGVIGKPLYISEVIAELQGNTSSTYCIRTLLATSRFKSVRYSITVSLSHGELERYIAIKHALRYETIVTEKRLTCLSALLWIILLTITVSLSFYDENTYL